MQDRIVVLGITFDDVLLEPAFSEILPSECNVSTRLTRNISLNVPVISSPMDTVTESDMAIALAQEGGIGIIHKNLSIERQSREVYKVKRSENGIIVDPVTLRPDATVGEARVLMQERNIGGVPITEEDGKLLGILTHRDLRFMESNDTAIADVMTKDNLVVASADTDLVSAQKILLVNKVEKLLLIDEQYRLQGLITIKDIDKNLRFPRASKDSRGRLRVGAAIGVDDFERAESVINTGVDVLVVDSAHGHSKNVIDTVHEIKRRWSDIDVIAGNVATEQGARDLVAAGVDAVKVGIGPGSICTTRIISGVGVPQLTAISNAVKGVGDSGVPIIADGGIRYSGDITKALAVGASCVMLGGLLAGLEESPGEVVLFQGRTFKTYRGMGSLGAMVKGSSERYRQSNIGGSDAKSAKKLVPEGVEGRVAYKGPLNSFLYQLIGGLRAGMGYLGSRTIPDLRQARFIQVSAASVRENHPHDISITQEAPNYTAEHAPIDGP